VRRESKLLIFDTRALLSEALTGIVPKILPNSIIRTKSMPVALKILALFIVSLTIIVIAVVLLLSPPYPAL